MRASYFLCFNNNRFYGEYLFAWVLCFDSVLLCNTCCRLAEEARAGCFPLVVLLMPCGCWYSIALSHGAVGLAAV